MIKDFVQGQKDAAAGVAPQYDATMAYHRGYAAELELIKIKRHK